MATTKKTTEKVTAKSPAPVSAPVEAAANPNRSFEEIIGSLQQKLIGLPLDMGTKDAVNDNLNAIKILNVPVGLALDEALGDTVNNDIKAVIHAIMLTAIVKRPG